MSANLIETVTGHFSPDLIQNAAGAVGQTPNATRTAMQGAVPTILAGLTQTASTESGAARLFGALSQAGTGGILGKLGSLSGGGNASEFANLGQGMLGHLVGENKLSSMTELIAGHAGVPRPAASRALSWVMPIIAGVLGKEISARRLNARGLSDLLFGQKKALMDSPYTPPGLAGALGLRDLSDLGGTAARVEEPTISTVSLGSQPAAARTVPREVPARAHKRSPWAIAIPLLLVAGLLAVWGISSLMRHKAAVSRMNTPTVEAPKAPTVETPAPTAPPAEAPRAQTPDMDIQEPAGATPSGSANEDMAEKLKVTGATVTVDPNSKEGELAQSLKDDSTQMPKRIVFEKMVFETGAANPSDDSKKTVDKIAEVLVAYPNSRVRLEGHADGTGSSDVNGPLSKERADNVKQMLVKDGVDASRIETVGMAEQNPAESNDTDEGRAKNRRVDLVIISK